MQGVTEPWECERVLVILYSIYAMSAWGFLERTFASPNKCFMLQWGSVWNRHVIKWADFSYCLAARQLPGRTASYESDRVNMITWISDVISIILYAGIRWSIGVFYAITAWDFFVLQQFYFPVNEGLVVFLSFLFNGSI